MRKEIENLDDTGVDPLSVFEYGYTPNGMIETWKQQAGTASPETWSFGGACPVRAGNIAGNRTHERHGQGELDDSPGASALYNENNQLVSMAEESAIRFAGEIFGDGRTETTAAGGAVLQCRFQQTNKHKQRSNSFYSLALVC